ncbi:tandem-95 repeat protein [bacterium]|nr:tandem-95 repeat protein [bacterium]
MTKVNYFKYLLVFSIIISFSFSQGGRDLTGTTVDAYAFRAEGDSHTTVELSINVVSTDLNYADGVRFDFGQSLNILDAYIASDMMGSQPAVVIQGQEVLFGDSSLSSVGIFQSSMIYDFIVHLDGEVQAPISIDYTVYDDGWAQDFCIGDPETGENSNCELCEDYNWGVDCDGTNLTFVVNAEGSVLIETIETIEAPNQSPNILSLKDIENDQGKQMMIAWEPGDLINLPYFTEFSLYRYSAHPSDYVVTGNGVFYGEYFSSPGTGTSPNFGELILTREDSVININFDQNPLPVNDDFQVRWTGQVNAPIAGQYNFRTHSDDGVRLFVDGSLIIDSWFDYPPTSNTGLIELNEGQHTIVLEYYENGGGAMCDLFWTVPGQEESFVIPSGIDVITSDLGAWDFLSTVPWIGYQSYAALLNTLEDELPTAFKVVAHTEDPNVFFHSDPISGRSYDNIAPPAPSGLHASVEAANISLVWDSFDLEDFNYFNVYRGPDSLFQPNFSNFIGYSTTPDYIDYNAPSNTDLYYKVSAIDMGGNLGSGSHSAYAYIAENRAPQAFDVALMPAVPGLAEDITVSFVFFDPDGDSEVNTTIKWFKNGEVTTYSGLTLPAEATTCGDEWYATVIPSDGTLFGNEVSSNVVTVCGINTVPVWSQDIPAIHILEDSDDVLIEMSGFVNDTEQAISQLVLSVQGNTNEEVVSASFDGTKLVLGAISDDFFGDAIATLTLRADDGNDFSESFVDVSIDPVNDNPVVLSFNGPASFNEDESFVFEIYDFSVDDPDDDLVNMSLSVLRGDNYTQSTMPGMISTPLNFNGSLTVDIQILDGSGGAAIYTVEMNVNPVNDPSVLVTSGSDIISNGPATEEQPYSLTISWEDPDGTEDVGAYEVSVGGPAGEWLEVSNIYASGNESNKIYNAVLTGTPDDLNLSQNDVSFSVIDRSEGFEESFIEYYYIPINDVNDAPVIEIYTGSTEMFEDEDLRFFTSDFVVDDPDNSPIDFSLSILNGDNYTTGSDNSSVMPIENYNGSLAVKVFISDGDKRDSIVVDLNVVAVNDPIVLTNVADGQAVEESSFSTSVTWTDIDGSDIENYSVSMVGNASEWLTLGAVTKTEDIFGVILSGTPDDDNLYQNDISLNIIDNSEGEAVEKNVYFSIIIDAVNDAPVVVSYSGTSEIYEEENFTASIYDFIIEDVDSDFPFDFTLNAVPGSAYVVSDDALTITPASDFVGSLNVNYSISDGTTSVDFILPITVMQVNDAPSISRYNGAGSFAEDSEITFSSSEFGISDPDGIDQTFTISVLEGNNYIIVADGVGLKPVENFNGSLSVNVVAKDQDGALSNAFQFDLNVYAVNDVPMLTNLAITPAVPTIDDNLYVGYLTEDIDNDAVTVNIKWYKNGLLETSQTGIVVNASATVCNDEWYAIVTPNDGTADGESYTSNSVEICGANTEPVWSWSEPVLLEEDGIVEIDMYSKMYDAEHAPSQIVYSVITNTGSDKVSASVLGQVLTLTALELNYNGDAASNVTVNAYDGGYNVPVTFSVNITPLNDTPTATNDNINVDEAGTYVSSIVSGLLSNDVDVDGDMLSLIVENEPMHGILTVNEDQSISYVHDGSETTSDFFTYVSSDGEFYSNVAEVQISITPINDPPVIVFSTSFETFEETAFDILIDDFVIEDPDTDSESLTLEIASGENYSASAITNGYTITPALNFSGQLLILASISDGIISSDALALNVTVIGGNDAPEITNALSDISVDEDSGPIIVGLYGSEMAPYFSDNDDDDLVFEAYTAGYNLVMPMVMNDTLKLEFLPDAFGNDTVFVVGIDISGESVVDTVLVEVASINDAPVITTAAYFVIEEEDSFTVTLDDFVYYDIDSDESSLTLMVEDGDGYSVEIVEAGYKIIADENVTDTLYVPSTISDGDSLSNVWDLLVVVLPSNDAPIVVTAVNDIIVDEDADEVILSLLGSETSPYFYDSDGDSLNFDVFTNGSGVVSAFAASDSLYLSFYPNLSGQDTVFVVATDPSGDDVMDSIVVTVNTVNDSPEIVDAPSFEILEDDSIDVFIYQFVIRDPDTQLELITLDITAEDDTASVVNHYTITPIEYGFRIVPNENFFGDIPLVVKANDGFSTSDPFYVSVHVMPVNDAPMIMMPLADIIGEEDSDSIVVNLGGSETEPYFVDLDGDSIEFGIEAANNDIFDWSLDGYDLKILPMINMFGVDTLHIVGTDGSGAFVYDTVLVTINSVNDAPSAFTLITPDDSLEVVITAASASGGATIDVSWTMSEDVDGDSVGYGFILYNGPYALETPALYTANVEMTELSIPHTSALALLETAGLQYVECDWMVFATDGVDTTFSSEIRTLILDARPVLSVGEASIPEVFALHQNYPNPFNPTTTINYDIPESQIVSIMIYDVMGREVRTLINEFQELGYKAIRWDATDNLGRSVSAGMYIYTIQAGDFRQVRKMVLLK